jgi:hypothetical protein
MMLVEKGATDLQAERAVFGCDHIEVGIAATVQWGFPDVLVQGMDYLTKPEEGSEYAKIAALVNLGDKIARAAVCGRDSAMLEAEGQSWSLQVLGIEEEDLKKLLDESMEAIAAAAVISF